jgi:hypothetical protein
MSRVIFMSVALLSFPAVSLAYAGVTLGLGLDYTPIAKVQYVENPDLDYELVDNIAWQGSAFYDFGNGLRAGAIFDIYKKKIRQSDYRYVNLSEWGIGAVGDYAYDITESGNTFLVAGMEGGYGELSDKSASPKISAGSIWVGGLAGIRFHITYDFWCEIDYRLIWREYELNAAAVKKYLFSGSSLRLALEYPISLGQRNGTEKRSKQ